MQLTRSSASAGADLAQGPDEAWPHYDEAEIAAVADILRSGKVNQWTGSKVFAFQDAYADLLGDGRSIALANGSLALELALRAYGVGPGDEVIVTPRSFVASAFCVRLVGATPVFVDVERDSGNMAPDAVAAAVTPRTRAIIPVHLGGWPADMPRLMEIGRAHSITVIEDCAQAHGAEIDGRPVGSFGDAAAFSFCQDKIISTAGEGGLVHFKDRARHDWAWSFKDHGKNPRKMAEPPKAPGFRWLHDSVGTNWRMTEISAAIGLSQLAKLPEWRRLRVRNARIWHEALTAVDGLRMPMPEAPFTGAFYKLYAYLDPSIDEVEARRDHMLAAAAAEGLRLFSGSCSEMYLEKAFDDMAVEPLAVARELGRTSLMVEVHPTLDEARLRARAARIAEIVESCLR